MAREMGDGVWMVRPLSELIMERARFVIAPDDGAFGHQRGRPVACRRSPGTGMRCAVQLRPAAESAGATRPAEAELSSCRQKHLPLHDGAGPTREDASRGKACGRSGRDDKSVVNGQPRTGQRTTDN